MKKKIVDTNVILRFLLGEPENQAKMAETIFSSAKKETLFIPDIVIAEVIFVLLSYYKKEKQEIIDTLSNLLLSEVFDCNRSIILTALKKYETKSISFIDAYLLALRTENNYEEIITFDKKLYKLQ